MGKKNYSNSYCVANHKHKQNKNLFHKVSQRYSTLREATSVPKELPVHSKTALMPLFGLGIKFWLTNPFPQNCIANVNIQSIISIFLLSSPKMMQASICTR